ncbi:hypothetical protein AB432_018605 [Brevibacillus brevis]|uniref:AAA domain-containing protein n=1 Tax=Brevibacillus brevis TaxID=1393 RepID=A0A2Z4MKD5_BREBE|nr:AAA family ATPase [Brevibacillus brevis]AWX56934.1 hypothetical protein AB432_018605 [Brevibacillus brevis]
METITFYSYKGGVGRTLALANIASYLSRFGQKVCILDFDLEAPGVHYKFPEIGNELNKGLIDYIYEFSVNGTVFESIKDFSVCKKPIKKTQGEIVVIPAGAVLNGDYWRKLAYIDWHKMFYSSNSEGTVFFLDLQEKIKNEIAPDFLLIDSRTGVTEISSLCTSLLADKVVFLSANNLENLDGAKQIIKGISKAERFTWQEPVQVLFTLTRIPLTNELKEKELIKNVCNYLNDNETVVREEDIGILHSEREIELAETLLLTEHVMDQEIPLLKDYLRLFSKTISENIIEEKLGSILDQITSGERLLEEPELIQKELEEIIEVFPHRLSLEKLIDFYVLRNESREKILLAFHKLYDYFGIQNDRMLLRYKSIFMKMDNRNWTKPRFNLKIIEHYLTKRTQDYLDVKLRLANTYHMYQENDKALELYHQLFNELTNRKEIVVKMVDIYMEKGEFSIAYNLIKDCEHLFDLNSELTRKKLYILLNLDKSEEVLELFGNNNIGQMVLDEDPELFLRICKKFNYTLNSDLLLKISENALSNYNFSLFEVLKETYSQNGKIDEFRKIVDNHRNGHETYFKF